MTRVSSALEKFAAPGARLPDGSGLDPAGLRPAASSGIVSGRAFLGLDECEELGGPRGVEVGRLDSDAGADQGCEQVAEGPRVGIMTAVKRVAVDQHGVDTEAAEHGCGLGGGCWAGDAADP
jgi:hypothetical protein